VTPDSDVLPAIYSLDGLPVSDYREWVRQRPDDRSKKPLAEGAMDTFEALANQKAIEPDDLTPIIDAARSPYIVAWDIGMHFLCRVAAIHEVGRNAMRNLLACGKAQVRVNLITELHDRLPKEFCIELIRRGLVDRSKRVREAAADKARILILHELLPDLKRCEEDELQAEMKLAMNWAIALIRDGYFVNTLPDGSKSLVVRISDGYPAQLFSPGPSYCQQANIDERNPQAAAEEIRRVHGRTERKFRWDT
jgi:hypothetical protein